MEDTDWYKYLKLTSYIFSFKDVDDKNSKDRLISLINEQMKILVLLKKELIK